LDSGM